MSQGTLKALSMFDHVKMEWRATENEKLANVITSHIQSIKELLADFEIEKATAPQMLTQ